MSTVQTSVIESTNLEDTLRLAEQVGARLRGGEVIEMVSDLGGGKTAFIRGMARGMGVKDVVHSPSFTLSYEHQGSRLRLHHFDFYRLQDPGIMRDELAEVIGDSKAVVAIEWADIVEDTLPPKRLTVKIVPTGETSRRLEFQYPEELSHLIIT